MPTQPALFDAPPDGLLAVRGDVVIHVNRAFAALVGADAADVVGQRLTDLLASGERDRLTSFEEQRDAGWQTPVTFRLRLRRHDGSGEVPADVRFVHTTDDEGPLLVISARDASGVTRAEALMGRLAEIATRDRNVADPNALLDDAEPIFLELGWRVGFIEIVDDGATTRRILAAPEGDPVGEYGRGLVDQQTPLEQTAIIAEVVRTKKMVYLDNLPVLMPSPVAQARRLTESMIEARLSRSVWCPVLEHDHVLYVLGVTGRDLSEHDAVAMQLFANLLAHTLRIGRLREELIRNERLAAIGEAAAFFAHEVRNPLAVVVNATEILARRIDDDVGRQLVDAIGEETARLRKMADEWLTSMRRSSAASPTSLELSQLVNEAISAARQDPLSVRSEATFELAVPGGVHVPGDRLLLQRTLVNLLTNALQHVPRRGRVRVSAAPEAHEVHLRIFNEGPPIPHTMAETIFQPFYSTRKAGTGLGLAFVKRAVEGLGGRIVLEDRSDGVAFSLWLPISDRDGSEALATG